MKRTTTRLFMAESSLAVFDTALAPEFKNRGVIMRQWMKALAADPPAAIIAMLQAGASADQIPPHEKYGFTVRLERTLLDDYQAGVSRVFLSNQRAFEMFAAALFANRPAVITFLQRADDLGR